MEFIPYGNLYYFLHNENNVVDWPTKLKIALDIAEAMQYLHSRKPSLVHMDLKSPNGFIFNFQLSTSFFSLNGLFIPRSSSSCKIG